MNIPSKDNILVIDTETYSTYDINSQNDMYLKTAKIKWIGLYSYKTDKYYIVPAVGHEEGIKNIIKAHNVVVTFNGDEFDIPIMKNTVNKFWPESYINSIDCQMILGRSNDPGKKFKDKGSLMGYHFKRNSLKHMAEVMKLQTQKEEIDIEIFAKDYWTEEEQIKIKSYLKADVEVTKQMFDKLWDYWISFTDYLDQKNIDNFSWIKSKSGALSYKIMCNIGKLKEEYGQDRGTKEEIGGIVLLPIKEEETDVWYFDVNSLYPHIMMMFNIYGNPTLRPDAKQWFSGNEAFKIDGKYASDEQHILSKKLQEMFIERKKLKKSDPKAYALKIILNGNYGFLRSPLFKSTYYAFSGSDICKLGQQINHLMGKFFEKYQFTSLSGDTDSRFIKYIGEEKLTYKEQFDLLMKAKKELIDYILQHSPFPSPTFDISSETGEEPIRYIMYGKDNKTGKFLKKNYCYIYKDKEDIKVKIVGLPIKKDNATELGLSIFYKHIEPRMKKELKGKFDSKWVKDLINEELKNNLNLIAQEYKVRPYHTYSEKGKLSITAQVSKIHFGDKSGSIKLIKNNRIGKIGKAEKYCTIAEAKSGNLKIEDLDLTKVINELQPFCKDKLDMSKRMKTIFEFGK